MKYSYGRHGDERRRDGDKSNSQILSQNQKWMEIKN